MSWAQYSYIIVHKITSYGQVMNYADRIEGHCSLRHELTTNRYKYMHTLIKFKERL